MGKNNIILIIEDNLAHAELIKRSLEMCPIHTDVYHLTNGEDALKFFSRKFPFDDIKKYPDPHLVLLDLRIPRFNGLELLKEVKITLQKTCLPIVVLSTSSNNTDICNAYANGANSYLVKPIDFTEFNNLIQDTLKYWLKWNTTTNKI